MFFLISCFQNFEQLPLEEMLSFHLISLLIFRIWILQLANSCILHLTALSAVLEQGLINLLMKWVASQDEVICCSVTVWQTCALPLCCCVSFWLIHLVYFYLEGSSVVIESLTALVKWTHSPTEAFQWQFWCWCHEAGPWCLYRCNIFQSTNFIRGENRSNY